MTKKLYQNGAAWMSGKVIPISDAKIQVNDWGVIHSDITYDVVPVWNGAFFRLNNYLNRFKNSIDHLKLDIGLTIFEIEKILYEMVAVSGLKNAYVSMVASRGVPIIPGTRDPRDCKNFFYAWCVPYIFIMKPDLENSKRTAWIAKSVIRINEKSINPQIKNYQWGDFTKGLFEAKQNGYETVILLDQKGNVTEGPGFNLFACKKNILMTPDSGILEGISRQTILEIASEFGIEIQIKKLTLDELTSSDEVFISSSGGGVLPLTKIDDKIYNNGKPGPKTKFFHKKYWEWIKRPELRTKINYL